MDDTTPQGRILLTTRYGSALPLCFIFIILLFLFFFFSFLHFHKT